MFGSSLEAWERHNNGDAYQSRGFHEMLQLCYAMFNNMAM
jgi:hypothetical protein